MAYFNRLSRSRRYNNRWKRPFRQRLTRQYSETEPRERGTNTPNAIRIRFLNEVSLQC